MADPKLPSGGSDRARRINSLHNQVNGMIIEQDKKTMQVSSEISSLTKEQQRLMQQLDLERSEFTNETASAYNGVVKNLGKTIQNLSIGVKNITTDTAKATAGAIGQYGKAIGEDISINKQNTVVMALAKATPLFGYFAAKFMETDVFHESAKKIKDKVSGTLASAGESLANVFKKKQADNVGAPVPPKLQEGGFVKKGGMVEVHAAEVVSPIDKILERIDASGGEKVVEKLNLINKNIKFSSVGAIESQDKMLSSLNELKAAMIGSADRLQVGWQKTLLENPAFRAMTTFGQLMDTVIKAPFRAMFGIRGGFLGDVRKATRTSNIYQQQVNLLALIYTKGMTFLRNIDKYTKVTAEALVGEEVSPISSKTYTLFGKIKEFMTTRSLGNVKENAFDNFAKSLKLDKGALRDAGITSFSDLLSPGAILRNMGFTKANIFGKVREGPEAPINDKMVAGVQNAVFDAQFKMRAMKKRLDASKAGRLSSDVYSKGQSVVQGAMSRGKRAGADITEVLMAKSEKAWSSVQTWPGRMVSELSKIRKAEEDREVREGPHSPSMAENVATTSIAALKGNKLTRALTKTMSKIKKSIFKTAKLAKKNYKDNYKSERDKQRKLAEIRKSTRDTAQTAKRNRKDTKGWIPMIVGFFSNMLSKMGRVGKMIKSLSVFFLGPFFKLFKLLGRGIGGVAKLFGKGGGKLITGGAGKLGKTLGGARGALAGGGVRGLGGWAARGGLKMAGAAAGAAGGIVAGAGMGLWDMAQAIMSGDEKGFVGNFIVRGLAGFIGGTSTGAGGMISGAAKGAGMGAAIGSIVPGIGTAIGAGIGGFAGGILGFVGGAKISEAIKNSLSGLGEVIGVIWKIVKWPYQVLRETVKSIYYVLKFLGTKIWNFIDNLLSGPGFIGDMWEKFKNFFGKIGGAIGKFFSMIGGLFNVEKIKDMFVNILFPIPKLIAGLKNIGGVVDKWLIGLPVIGRAYKWAKRSVKSIQSGDLSESLNRALNDKPQLLTDSQRDKLSSAEIAKIYADEEAARQKAEEERTQRQTDKLNENSDKNTKSQNQTTVVSTNNIVTSNSSSNVSGGGGGQQSFPSIMSYSTSSEQLAGGIAGGNI